VSDGAVGLGDLVRIPLFAALPGEFLEPILIGAETRRYADGTALFQIGEPADHVFAIERGHVTLRAAHEAGSTIVMTVGPGEVLGWASLRDDARWLTTGRAVGDVEAIVFTADAVLDRLAAGGAAARQLARRLFGAAAGHLHATQSQLLRVGREGVITGG
jgi:CRP-like cAMP-binding protein